MLFSNLFLTSNVERAYLVNCSYFLLPVNLTPLQKLPKNVGDLGKIIDAKGFKKVPKVQKIAQSGHTGLHINWKTKN